MSTYGIYLIANDRMYDLAVALLNSVRTFEPTISVCIIPYNDEYSKIRSLAFRYGCSVWTDHDLLHRCDAIGEAFLGFKSGQYRKLALWDGPFDYFAYFDIDMILLNSLEIPFACLSDLDILVATSDIPSIRHFVWKNSLLPEAAPFDTQFAANTGCIFSRRKTVTIEFIENAAKEALSYIEFMELECAEQPFLNYLIVTSGARYSSIHTLCKEQQRSNLPREVWSGRFSGDLLELRHPVLAIHWAGEWQHGEHLKSPIWKYFRNLQVDYQQVDAKALPIPAL